MFPFLIGSCLAYYVFDAPAYMAIVCGFGMMLMCEPEHERRR